MGFNKMYLPEVKELKEYLTTHGNQAFLKRWVETYQRRDAVIGPSESIEFIKQFINQTYNVSRSDNVDVSGSTKA